jgi:hypothetical protein
MKIPSAVLGLLNSYRRKDRAIFTSALPGFESAYKDVQQSEKIKYQKNEKNKKTHIKRDPSPWYLYLVEG